MVPNQSEVTQLIEEGIKLHEEGDYLKAVLKYQEAIRKNPENPLAYYEMSFSYFLAGKYDESLNAALKSTEFESSLLLLSYIQIGSNIDMLGKPKAALTAYQKALGIDSTYYLVHYNIAITYSNMSKYDESREYLYKAIHYNSRHASSHLALGNIYMEDNYRVPAILAYCQFLAIENNTTRTEDVLAKLQNLLQIGVSKTSETEIEVSIGSSKSNYEGDFSAADFFLSLNAAALTQVSDAINEPMKMKPIEIIVSEIEGLAQILDELYMKIDDKRFAWKYYAPFLIELGQRQLIESFVYFSFQIVNEPTIQGWLQNNPEKIEELQKWIDAYQSPIVD
ncbi:MAG: tetratricopeptide repeat protein [Candidatus Marinimicrobia bacterium]|nr:tetratricopeptide repeat protein [Candidatus Neomarinimicrobiota bacterium]